MPLKSSSGSKPYQLCLEGVCPILNRRIALQTRTLALMSFMTAPLLAQAPVSVPDTVLFINGEQLSGTVEKVDRQSVTFKSLMAGEITVDWANIRELHSSQTFALLKAGVGLERRNTLASLPLGAVSVQNKQLTLKSPTTETTVPIAQVDQLISSADFTKAMQPRRFTQGWAGTAAAGLSLVRATQNSTNFNGTIALTRGVPLADWLPARSRTSIDFSQAYGATSAPSIATVKTNIFHAGAEHDKYFTPKLFSLVETAFDHNSSLKLDLEQAYGAGVGINLIKTPVQRFDAKGGVRYEKQSFLAPTASDNLIAAIFSETYLRNLPHKLVFTELGSVSPAFNNTNAYSAHANASLGFPVFRAFGLMVSGVDDYLNDAPAGTKKNSTQFTTNLTYTIRPR